MEALTDDEWNELAALEVLLLAPEKESTQLESSSATLHLGYPTIQYLIEHFNKWSLNEEKVGHSVRKLPACPVACLSL